MERIRDVVHTVRKNFFFPSPEKKISRRTLFDSLCQDLCDWETKLIYVNRFYKFESRCLIDDGEDDYT